MESSEGEAAAWVDADRKTADEKRRKRTKTKCKDYTVWKFNVGDRIFGSSMISFMPRIYYVEKVCKDYILCLFRPKYIFKFIYYE